MKIIFGLGNPGKEYRNTRHNVGFLFLDYLKKKWAGDSVWSKGLESLQLDFHERAEKILLVKPQTFMNSSGRSVVRYVNFYKLSLEEILIVHDDLDIPLGNCKLNFNKGPKVHNGVLDIENKLSDKGFWRLRIGIENRSGNKFSGKKYVLGKFSSEEQSILEEMFKNKSEGLIRNWFEK